MSDYREDRIRQRAYRLWQNDGSPEGRADDYWNRAVAQIDAEVAADDGTAAAPEIESDKRRNAGDPLQEEGALPPAELAREKRRGR